MRKDALVEQLTQNEISEELKEIKKQFEDQLDEVRTLDQLGKLEGLQGQAFEFRYQAKEADARK